jgi:hypothetical protein
MPRTFAASAYMWQQQQQQQRNALREAPCGRHVWCCWRSSAASMSRTFAASAYLRQQQQQQQQQIARRKASCSTHMRVLLAVQCSQHVTHFRSVCIPAAATSHRLHIPQVHACMCCTCPTHLLPLTLPVIHCQSHPKEPEKPHYCPSFAEKQ